MLPVGYRYKTTVSLRSMTFAPGFRPDAEARVRAVDHARAALLDILPDGALSLVATYDRDGRPTDDAAAPFVVEVARDIDFGATYYAGAEVR